MSKSISKNYRFDELTIQLLSALQEHEDKKESEIVRSAIYWYAKQYLPDDKMQAAVNSALTLDNL